MWAAAYRGLKNLGQNTTAAAEGFNASIKGEARASRRDRRGRTAPWLLWLIYDVLEPRLRRVRMTKEAGAVLNTKQILAARTAIEAAVQVPNSSIAVLDAELGHCTVLSVSRVDVQYDVRDVLSMDPHCDCPEGLRGRICKHAAACMRMLGYTDTDIMTLHGSLRGSVGGSTKLQLGAGVVRGGAPSAGSPKPPVEAQLPAPMLQPDRTVDHRARQLAVLDRMRLLISSGGPCDPWMRADTVELEQAEARMLSSRRECNGQAREDIVNLRQSQSTRPDLGLQRQPDLLGMVMKGARGSGKRQRVEPDPPIKPVPDELVVLRDAPRRDMPKAKSIKEQVATFGADDDAEEAAVQASQGIRSVSDTWPVLQAPPSPECASLVALLLRAPTP
jgi:hypothetical protein